MTKQIKKCKFEYYDVESVDEELNCTICVRPLNLPVYSSKCGHTFCQECIRKWHKKSSICPVCREKITIQDYLPVTTRVVINQLSRFHLKCKLCQQINIDDRKQHEDICPKKIIKCPSADLSCSWIGSREELNNHLDNCSFTTIRPILDHLINQLETIRKTQIEQQRFIQIFINNGYTLSNNCTISPCYYNRSSLSIRSNQISCTLCKQSRRSDQIYLHSCLTLTCICILCFKQYNEEIQPLNLKRKLLSSEESTDDDDDE